jgi:DNA-binding transcriptional MerR regulator
MDIKIPDKLYFRIGEVSEITGLRPSVLRYWETEFDLLRPQKTRSGQRIYCRNDVELISEIKKLLYGEKLTIAGAKKKLSAHAPLQTDDSGKEVSIIRDIREELKIILLKM